MVENSVLLFLFFRYVTFGLKGRAVGTLSLICGVAAEIVMNARGFFSTEPDVPSWPLSPGRFHLHVSSFVQAFQEEWVFQNTFLQVFSKRRGFYVLKYSSYY